MSDNHDPFVKALEALVMATDVTRPVEPVAQEWYMEADYSMDDCSDAITDIVHTAISRLQAVRVNTWKQQCEEATSPSPVHSTTTIGGRPHEILYDPDGDSVSIYDALDQSEVILGFEELGLVCEWAVNQHIAATKPQAPVPCNINECCCKCMHQVMVIDIDSDTPMYSGPGCTYWLKTLNKVHIGNFAHGPGDCDGYTPKQESHEGD